MNTTPNMCPRCGGKGKRVKPITLQSLLTPEAANNVSDTQYRFCDAIDCDTVYFGENGQTFAKDDLTVRVGVKEHDAPRHVCYCFDHTIESINAEVQESGQSSALDDIKTRMETACWCETKSPLGGCCLGTVGKYVKQAMAEHGDGVTASVSSDENADCCAVHETAGAAKDKERGFGMLVVGGSLASAMAASACCWLPLLLIAFGVSVGGVSAWFEQYRWLFLSLASILLAVGFYQVYRRSPVSCEPGSACKTPHPKVQRFNRVMVWVAAVLVVGFSLFPNYAAQLISSNNDANAAIMSEANGQRVTLMIAGMTCEACAVGLQNALVQTPGVAGVNVNYDAGTATVKLTEDQPAGMEALAAAVQKAGFQIKDTP